MLKKLVIISTLTSALALSSGLTFAADPVQAQPQEQVYGRELMTEQERDKQRSKMRAAKTAEEREQFRTEQHERMKERAKAEGKLLSNKPPVGGGKGAGRMGGRGRNR